MNNTPETPKLPPHTPNPRRGPSRRMTAVLAAAMLAIGVAVGAAIGPAPTPSLAVGQLLPGLLPELLRAGEHTSAQTVAPPSITAQPTPQASAGRVRKRHRKHHSSEAAASETPTTEATTPTETSAPTSATKPQKTVQLPPVTKVWLIELGNSSFGELATHAAAAPYLEGSALPAGTLLSGWSALEASAFANAAALSASTPAAPTRSPQLLDTIVQPPCPEGAAGTQCAPDTPGALTTADEFLKATLPTITATAGYRENGLVVITFSSIAQPTASGLPAGAANATLTSQAAPTGLPPAGALLISPFVARGAKSAVTFQATSPKQSLEQLLRR